MHQKDPNYGRQREHVSPAVGPTGEPGGGSGSPSRMDAEGERAWSVIAHLSVLAGFVGLVPFGALVVWLVHKDRSSRVGFHALQSLWYQVAWVALLIGYFFVAFFLTIFTLGLAAFVMAPLGFLLPVVPLAHQCYAAYRVNQGHDFRCPLIGDMVEGR